MSQEITQVTTDAAGNTVYTHTTTIGDPVGVNADQILVDSATLEFPATNVQEALTDLDDTRIIGFGVRKIFFQETPPVDPQEGDLWIQKM